MMTTGRPIRKSNCTVCGRRLSMKSPAGQVRWQPSHVDDKGIYCVPCHTPVKNGKEKKGGRA